MDNVEGLRQERLDCKGKCQEVKEQAAWELERLRENLQIALEEINRLQSENGNMLGIEPQINAVSYLLEDDPCCDLHEPLETDVEIHEDQANYDLGRMDWPRRK